jgi:hypothetical protein
MFGFQNSIAGDFFVQCHPMRSVQGDSKQDGGEVFSDLPDVQSKV